MIKIVLHDEEDLSLLVEFIELITSELAELIAEEVLRKRNAP